MRLFLFMLFTLLPFRSFALVDYSESTSSGFKLKSTKTRPNVAKTPVQSSSSIKQSAPAVKQNSAPSFIDVTTEYSSLDMNYNGKDTTVSTFKFNTHINTPYNFFLDIDYDMHASDNLNLTSTGQYQKGNPVVTLGLNWVTFGTREDLTTIDFLIGYRVGMEGSDFATSRDDKIVALETTKRFYNFVLGLGYKVDMTGAPTLEAEQDIGSVQHIYANLGVEVSHDIKFLVNAEHVKIGTNSESTHSLNLQDEFSYGTISPKLILGIAPMVNMTLGGIFRTKVIEDISSLTQSRLYNLKGVYGNELNLGLNINL